MNALPDPQRSLREGLSFHRQGRLREASACYDAVLRVQPDNAEAYHLLGLANLQSGEPRTAVGLIRKAVDLDGTFAPFHLNLGNALQEAGELMEATHCFRQAFRLDQRLTIALFNLANALQKTGNLEQARESYQQYLGYDSRLAEAHYNLAHVLRQEGRMREAIDHLREAVAIEPHPDDCHFELGVALQQSGRSTEAIEELEHFIALHPDHAPALYTLAVALMHIQATGEALPLLQKCVVLDATVPEYFYWLAEANWRLNRYKQAKTAAQVALRLKPNYPEARGLLAIASVAGRTISEADANELIRESEGWQNLRLLTQLGSVLVQNGRTPQGLEILDRVESSDPPAGEFVKSALLLPAIIPNVESISFWRRRMEEKLDRLVAQGLRLNDPLGEVGRTNFYMAYHSLNDRDIQARIAAMYRQACPELSWEAPHVAKWRHRHMQGRKIRIGIVSQHLCNHTIGKLNRGWIEHLDREKFHVSVFQIPRSTRSRDALARKTSEAADYAPQLSTRFQTIRKTIADAELDLLFYTDIGMDPHTYFLAFSRLAPVQCVTWGHPVTTGLTTIDYFVSSKGMDLPGSEDQYTETLVRLEDVNTYYYRPLAEPDFRRTLLLEEKDSRLYVCAQTLFKLHPDYDACLAGILRRDPAGKLVFIRGAEPYMEVQLMERFARSMPDVLDRILFLPSLSQIKFFELLRIADVLLDTPYFGGGNTSLEAFGLDAPVVTWDRPLMRERITPALYRQMGVEELIAKDRAEYVALALRCAQDKPWRETLRRRIHEGSAHIFENRRVVIQMEEFFQQAMAAKG